MRNYGCRSTVVITAIVVVIVTVVFVMVLVVEVVMVLALVIAVALVLVVVEVVVVEEAVVAVVTKDPVGARGVVGTIVGVLAIDELMNVVNAVGITLDLAVPVSYMRSDGAIDFLIGTLVVIGGPPGIGIDVLGDVNANVFVGVMTEVKFVMPASLERFSC